MTIGIGFQCGDGVVLCADRQFTSKEGRFKYQKGKLGSSQRESLSLIYIYAGDPDRAELIFGKVSGRLKSLINETIYGVICCKKEVIGTGACISGFSLFAFRLSVSFRLS
jgi:hypothetical protein